MLLSWLSKVFFRLGNSDANKLIPIVTTWQLQGTLKVCKTTSIMNVESLKNNMIISKIECFFMNLKMYGFFNGLHKIHFYLHTCTHMNGMWRKMWRKNTIMIKISWLQKRVWVAFACKLVCRWSVEIILHTCIYMR